MNDWLSLSQEVDISKQDKPSYKIIMLKWYPYKPKVTLSEYRTFIGLIIRQ